MSQEKDFSLLRSFDLEAAKRGELVCFYTNGHKAKYFGESVHREGDLCIQWLETVDCVESGKFAMLEANLLRMVPLCWVEGKPVYKGDVLWHTIGKYFVTVENPIDAKAFRCEKGTFGYQYLTWTPPKVKRDGWVNIYWTATDAYCARTSGVYPSESEATANAQCGRIACVRIEWEETNDTHC